MTIPALLCFDVEPDERLLPWPPSPRWSGFDRLAAQIEELRDELSEVSGSTAHFGWFLRLDPQIEEAYGSAQWPVEQYGAVLERLTSLGDELGVHAHCWRRDGQEWWCDHADAEWVAHCVASSLSHYENAFGRPASAYRGGDRYIDEAVLRIIEDSGVAVDLTLEPGAAATRGLVSSERSEGVIPAVPSELQWPFTPNGNDPFRIGTFDGNRLLLVPLLAGFGFASDARPATAPPVETIALWTPPGAFRVLFEERLRSPGLTHVAFAVRSDVADDGLWWRWFRENLRFAAERLGTDASWVTPSAALGVLREQAAVEGAVAAISPARLEGVAAGLQAAFGANERAIYVLENHVRQLHGELAAERARAEGLETQLSEAMLAAASNLHRVETDLATHAARAAALHQDLHDVSTELHRIQPSVAEVEDLHRELDTLRSTRWWRLNRLVRARLAALVRRRPVR